MPADDFDIRFDQIMPGRQLLIRNFRQIERHRGEVRSLRDKTIHLSSGERIETELLLWGTGDAVALGYLGLDTLSKGGRLNGIAERCYSVFPSIDAPNLFLLG